MLKKLIFVALLLSVVWNVDLYGRTSASPASKGQVPSDKAALIGIKQSSGSELQDDVSVHEAAREPKSVRVILPPKDDYDLWSFWVSVALAVVGIFGVGVGIFTLLFLRKQTAQISRQANLMEQQLIEMKAGSEVARQSADAARVTAKASGISALAAEKSADAALAQIQTMKDRERARLVIHSMDIPEVGRPELIMNGLRPLEATLYVANQGVTKALNVRAYAVVSVVKNKSGGRYEIGFQQDLPSTIVSTDGGQLSRIHVSGFGLYGNIECRSPVFTDEETVQALSEGRMFLQVSGLLTFNDIFEDSHEIPYKYIWVSQGDNDGGRWGTMSRWYELGVNKDEVNADRQDENPN